MKTYIIVLLSLLMSFSSFSQEVSVDKDGTVIVDGKPTFKIEGKQGMASTSFTVSNLEGKQLVAADGVGGSSTMTVTFTGQNSSLDFPLGIGTKKVFAKDLAKMKVIVNGALNQDGVKRMLAKYNGRADRGMLLTENNTASLVVVQAPTVIVPRDIDAPIYINRNMITQDFKTIGTIIMKESTTSGRLYKEFVVKDSRGAVAGTATKFNNEKTLNIRPAKSSPYELFLENPYINDLALQQQVIKALVDDGEL